MASGERFIELPGQIRLSYFEQGDRAGVAILLLHGLADSWRSFERILPYLPASFRTIALSQRGHGDSSRPAGGYRSQDFADDLDAFMDALDVQAAVIVAHSAAGFAAQRFALDHPDRTLGLVFVASPLTLYHHPRAQALFDSNLATLSDPIPPAFVHWFLEETVLSDQVPEAFIESMFQESLKVPARVWREVFGGFLEDNFVSELSRIEAPSLLLWGDQDTIVSRGDQEALAAALADSRLVTYTGAGHSPNWEVPSRVAADLVNFVMGL